MDWVSVMGKPKKKTSELTTEEALKRLFGNKGATLLKRIALELDDEKPCKSRKAKKKKAKDDDD